VQIVVRRVVDALERVFLIESRGQPQERPVRLPQGARHDLRRLGTGTDAVPPPLPAGFADHAADLLHRRQNVRPVFLPGDFFIPLRPRDFDVHAHAVGVARHLPDQLRVGPGHDLAVDIALIIEPAAQDLQGLQEHLLGFVGGGTDGGGQENSVPVLHGQAQGQFGQLRRGQAIGRPLPLQGGPAAAVGAVEDAPVGVVELGDLGRAAARARLFPEGIRLRVHVLGLVRRVAAHLLHEPFPRDGFQKAQRRHLPAPFPGVL